MAPMIFTSSLASLSLLLPVLTPCRGLVPSGTRRVVCGSLLSGVYDRRYLPTRVSGAGDGASRRPGAEEPSTPLGRAAEHARSAAARQPGPPTASPPPAPISLSAMGGRRPPTFVSPAMPPAGWLVGLGSGSVRIFVDEPQGQIPIPVSGSSSMMPITPIHPISYADRPPVNRG